MEKQIRLNFQSDRLCRDNIKNPSLLRDVPYDKIYEAARKEASRKKPVFFVHKYFARRITCNFRMMLIGALLPYEDEIWEAFYESHNEANLSNLTVLDPFMGGGTTLFESIRLGAKTIGSDLQPLSNFVSRALVAKLDEPKLQSSVCQLEKNVADKIMKYQKTLCPECGKTADIMYTFHVKKAKTKCTCGDHKLFSSFVLALKKDTFTLVCPKCGDVFEHNFKENGPAKCRCGFAIESPRESFVQHGKFSCPECGESFIISNLKEETGYPFDTEQIAIEYYCDHCKGHGYKRVDENDRALYKAACNMYDEIADTLPIPKQLIPEGYNTNQIRNHGYKCFSDLFNKRQLLGLGLLLKEINSLEDQESKFWLTLAFSGMLEMNNMFCRYQANAYKICNIFFNHAYVPVSMPVENNVWGTKLGTGNFVKTINKIIRGKRFCNEIYDISTTKKNGKVDVQKVFSDEAVSAEPVGTFDKLAVNHPVLLCQDSSNLSVIPDESVDIVLTDPPFGANVMYSELIDFFHSWLYYSSLAKDLGFISPLSPKEREVIVNPIHNKTQEDYENGLTGVFSECNRVMKSDGLLIFSFHDRSIDSWYSILRSIDNAGFNLVKSYPLHAETRTGAHTSNKNSIALDIMLVCRKKEGCSQNEVSFEVRKRIEQKTYRSLDDILDRLTAVGAEITIPDIENIFISEYICAGFGEGISLDSLLNAERSNIEECIGSLTSYCDKYPISEKRSGWWSDLFNSKWEM